jgi:hypothetical protein
LLILTLLATPFLSATAGATDVDGADDCARAHEDFGDAPECIPAYPSGVIGNFPTCLAACTPGGTADAGCLPGLIPQAATPAGFVRHIQQPDGYWLSCYPTPLPTGIDNETDGKVNVSPIATGLGISACSQITTDCVEPAFGSMFFDQDECYADGSDAGVVSPPMLNACQMGNLVFNTMSCQPRQAFLNICVDFNQDGDWLDDVQCDQGCAVEWAVRNVIIPVPAGCLSHTSPAFQVGPDVGPSWLRITITDEPVPPDFPINGSASLPGQSFNGGETEDYPAVVSSAVGVGPSTWGGVKRAYR